MITNDIIYLGVNDHQVDLFEGQYTVPAGMSYNSYLIRDEKTAVMDTVDIRFGGQWLDNIQAQLGGKAPDYLVIQHMEPDHSANIEAFLRRYPDTTVVANSKIFTMIGQFFPDAPAMKKLTVTDGGTLCLGRHTLTFVFAPMVHWPEVMVSYDSTDKVLFSADGFGKFGALDVEQDWDDEARRYYIGIVGKYGAQVQKLLKTASQLDIQIICPLHGPVLRENLGHYLEKYDIWSSYRPEEEGVLIAYASIYGHTAEAARLLAKKLTEKGEKVVLADLARTDMALCVANAFRFDRLVLASVTYNGSIFPVMHAFLHNLAERSFQNRTVALMENGTWAPAAARVMTAQLEGCKNLTWLEEKVTIRSAMNKDTEAAIDTLADALCKKKPVNDLPESAPASIDIRALNQLSCGIFLLSTRTNDGANGCIINTCMQVASNPTRIAVSVLNTNHTCEMLKQSGVFALSMLDDSCSFATIQHFGYQSGRDVNKFAGLELPADHNDLPYLDRSACAMLSASVVSATDLGSHTLFVAEVTGGKMLSNRAPMTYAYYQENVKPKAAAPVENRPIVGWRCLICNYVYEGSQLPEDYLCPLCGHGPEDFEPIYG